MNCWDYMKCGFEKGGKNTQDRGVCPAFPDHGNTCARVAGTLCGGTVQGIFAVKLLSCLKCAFYNSPNYKKAYLNSPYSEEIA